jgi:hypothetical protein
MQQSLSSKLECNLRPRDHYFVGSNCFLHILPFDVPSEQYHEKEYLAYHFSCITRFSWQRSKDRSERS